MNDAPSFAASVSASIREDTAPGSAVGSVVSASDEDGDTLTYAIVSGNGEGVFVIDSASGQVTTSATAGGLDYDAGSRSFSLGIRATDTSGATATTVLPVSLLDVNEAPTLSASDVTIAEDEPVGATVLSSTASDPDAGESLTYAIVAGNVGGAFSIHRTSGKVTVASPLDHESVPAYSLTLAVVDKGGLQGTVSVVVTVSNVNEHPVIAAGELHVPENSGADTAVGSELVVSDPDAGSAHTIAIVGGDSFGLFKVDGARIRLAKLDGRLNFEGVPNMFALTVKVTDNGSPALSTTGLQRHDQDPFQFCAAFHMIPADKEVAWRKALQVCPSHVLPPHHSLSTV